MFGATLNPELIERKKKVLRKCYATACDNLFHYSNNYLMTEPKPGFEEEWTEALEECEILNSIVKEIDG